MGYEAYLLKCLRMKEKKKRMKENIHVKNATQSRLGLKMGSVWSWGLELQP